MKLFFQKIVVYVGTAIAVAFFYAWGAITGYPIQQMTIHSQGGTMLEGQSLLDLFVFLFAGGGTIAVILARLPGWDGLDPNIKKGIVALVNVLAPVVLIVLKAYVPPDFLAQTPAQILAGVVMAALSFMLHLVDQWLAGLAAEGKAKAAKA